MREDREQTYTRWGIRVTLTTFLTLIVVIPLVVLLTILFWQSFQQTRQQIINQLESVSVIKSDEIEAFLSNNSEILELTAVNIGIQQELIPLLQLETREADTVANITENLILQLGVQQSFEEYFVYDTSGLIVLSTNSEQVGKIATSLPFYEPSLETAYIQPPYYEISSRSLNMVFSRPILDQNGDVIGVFAGRADIARLSEIMLERSGLGETGETYLVSLQSNYLLTESRFEGYELSRSYSSLGIEQSLDGFDGSGSYINYRDAQVFGVYRWIPELQAGLLAEIDQSEALSRFQNQILISLIVGVIIALVTIMFGFLFSRWLSNPIIALATAAQEFERGNYKESINFKRSDEIGQLADSFKLMANAIEAREIDLQSLNETLEQRINERTIDLKKARDEALAAQRIANENSRLKSEFLSMMSHELRTPMNAIEGFTSIMLKRMAGVEYNDKAERYMHKIQSNSQRLLGLINDFLDLSRIESGRLELAHSPMSPKELAQKWKDNLSVLAENKGLEFDVFVDPDLPETIYGDEESLSKIATNLVGNAIKFTEEGTIAVSIARHGDQMELAVNDTGIGIPPHARDFIFEEFRQVDQSSKRQHGGTGLGLAIVQKLAREMGGTVTLQSEVGVGSIFAVLLPMHVQTEKELAQEV